VVGVDRLDLHRRSFGASAAHGWRTSAYATTRIAANLANAIVRSARWGRGRPCSRNLTRDLSIGQPGEAFDATLAAEAKELRKLKP
jgi:hypothetical protein